MNRIIIIAALITIALAAYGASANPFDSGNFPNDYARGANSAAHDGK